MCFVVCLQDLTLVVDDDVSVVYFLRICLALSYSVDSTDTQPDVIGERQLSGFKLRIYFLVSSG